MKAAAFGLATALAVGLASACAADDMLAAENVAGTSVGFVLKGTHSNATLSISGPGGFRASTFSRGGAVALDLSQFGALPDGSYRYQLTAASSETVRVKNDLDDGRGSGRRAFAQKPVAKSGAFYVKGGRIVDDRTPERSNKRISK